MTLTWIVGLDGSESSSRALRWAAQAAARRSERVTPVAAWHVPLPIWMMSGRRAVEVDRAGIAASVAVHAAEAVAALDHGEAVDEPQVIEGHPASTLADMTGPDTAVVVGRRGIGAVKHRLLGSVSQHLATHAAGPVVVVPDEWKATTLQRIVVAFDGSEHASAALRWALSIAPDDAVVEVVVGIDVIPWLAPEDVVANHPDAVEAARARISAAADEVDPQGRAVRQFLLLGPRHALAATMEGADLVVVGPRGVGGLAAALLGSVTVWLLHEAQCPVAVVPSASPASESPVDE